MTNKEIDAIIARSQEINYMQTKIERLRDLMTRPLTPETDDEYEPEPEPAFRIDVGRALIDGNGNIVKSIACDETVYVSEVELLALVEAMETGVMFKRENLNKWISETVREADARARAASKIVRAATDSQTKRDPDDARDLYELTTPG